MVTLSKPAAVIEELARIVGAESVVEDSKALEEFSKDHSFVKPVKPMCVVYPHGKEEIQGIARFANEHGIPLIPVSSGPPHFHGDTIPRQGGIIVNLSKMKRILRIDSRNRAVRIEPGVTFGELVPELEKQGLKLTMPLLPRASKSVVTSVLEREPTLIPKYQFDYVDPLLTMEVIFGTGDEFRTGTASGPGQMGEFKSDMVNPSGPGDVNYFKLLSGAQGTFGIVTWAARKVEVVPTFQKLFFVPFQKAEELIEPMNRLLRYGIMASVADEILALNNFNLSVILAEKWPEEFKVLRENLPPWTLLICLGGYRLAEERIRIQERCLMEIAQDLAFEPTLSMPGAHGRERAMLELLSKPWTKEPYWKLRYKTSCHDIFFLAPPSKAPTFAPVMYELAARHGYPRADIGGYIQPVVQGHSYHIEFNLPYDPSDPREVETIQKLLIDATETFMGMGAFFSRPYYPWADIVYSKYAEGVATLRKVKETFDPNNIMNPGVLSL